MRMLVLSFAFVAALFGQKATEKEEAKVKALVSKNAEFIKTEAAKGYDFNIIPYRLNSKEKDPEGCDVNRCLSVTFGKFEGNRYSTLLGFFVVVNMEDEKVYIHRPLPDVGK